MLTLASLREQLRGCRVADLSGRDGDGGVELVAIEFVDGTVLRLNWRAGTSGTAVGADVVRGRRRERRPVLSAH